jgi:DNA modification methylase
MSDDCRLILGDCLDVLATLPDASVDAVVTDPPAGIGFMGKAWDRARDRAAFVASLTPALAECLRVARPGARMLCWGIPRTSHWTATAVEDAGWFVEDRVSHLFGQGFPKGKGKLKPAVEDWWLARNPTKGATPLNIEACRVGASKEIFGTPSDKGAVFGRSIGKKTKANSSGLNPNVGRWPANLVLTHSPGCNGVCVEGCPVRIMGEQSGTADARQGWRVKKSSPSKVFGPRIKNPIASNHVYEDSGTAARFFPNFTPDAPPFRYQAKARSKDRGDGNTHPTVKSQALMRWLCTLVTPEGGVILDPFMGSGTTGVAAVELGHSFIGVEMHKPYVTIARKRINAALASAPAPAHSA